jgi:hypothetical protein
MKYIKVQAEEMLIGGILGLGFGLALVAPFTAGLRSINPMTVPGLIGFLQASVLIASAVLGVAIGSVLAARQERDSHLRGAEYIPQFGLAHARLQADQRELFSEAQKKHEVRGIKIGGVEWSRKQEVRHMVVVGSTGGGKTVLLTSLIDQALARGDRVVLLDPKGDFTKMYFDPANTILVGPWDERATLWDAAADIDSPALIEEFAQAAVGDVQGDNKSFHDNAATVLAGVLKYHRKLHGSWTWGGLAEDLSRTPQEIAALAAQGDPSVKIAVPSAFSIKGLNNGDNSVFSIVGSAAKWMRGYAAVDRPGVQRFSVTKWLLRKDRLEVRMVILNRSSRYKKASKAIFGAMLQPIVDTVNSATMPERGADEPGGLWFVMDEFPQAGQVVMEAIQTLNELGRSRGIRDVQAMQGDTQLSAVLGGDKAAPLTDVQGAKVYLQVSDKTAKAISERIGTRDVNRLETTSENGALICKSKKLVTQKVIEAGEIMGLKVHVTGRLRGVEMIVQIGDVLGRVLQPFPVAHPEVAEAFVESEAWREGAPRESNEDDDDNDFCVSTPIDIDSILGN